MNWTIFLVIVLVIAAYLGVKQLSFISPKAACEYLRQGAVVVDVRNPGEFAQGHVPGAVNIPLNELKHAAPRRFPDRQQVLLVHCLGGGRSALAKRWLKAGGYPQVFNLGSYGRAERIVSQSAASAGQQL